MEKLEIVINVLKEKGVSVEKLSEDTALSDLGLDSLDTVEAMMDIEDKLSIEFTTDELANAKTIKDILNLISDKLK